MADEGVKIDRDFQDLFLKCQLGPKVLGKMLDICHFAIVAEHEDWQAAQNFMKIVLTKCGINYTGEKMVRMLAGPKGSKATEPETE